MPELSGFGAAAGLKVEDLIAISESQILVSGSTIFSVFMSKVAEKWNTETKMQAEMRKGAPRKRVYIPYSIDSIERYNLSSVFPQFDMYAVSPTVTSAALARTVSLMVSEYMLSVAPHKEKQLLLYGYQLKPMLLRNRSWAHLCISGGDPNVQVEFKQDDRELAIIYDSMIHSGKRPPGLLVDYMQARAGCYCTTAHSCEFQALVALMMLDRVDTNFRQICQYMKTHSTELLYFAIPGNKEMELYAEGPFPELGGFVVTDGGRVSVIFPNDAATQMNFTHVNYMELIARPNCVYDGVTYVKEFVNRIAGYLVYKVTRVDCDVEPGITEYRSWTDPDYRDKYTLVVPTLRLGGSYKRKEDWSSILLPDMQKDIFDSVANVAFESSGMPLDGVIMRRLYSKAFTYVVSGQITRHDSPLTVQEYVSAIYTLYCATFLEKYKSGVATSVLAPVAREAVRASGHGLIQALARYGTVAISKAFSDTFGRAESAARRAIEYTETRGDIPMPAFHESRGYQSYIHETSSDGVSTVWYPEEHGPSWGFSMHLPRVPQYKGYEDLHLSTALANVTEQEIEALLSPMPVTMSSLVQRVGRWPETFSSLLGDYHRSWNCGSVDLPSQPPSPIAIAVEPVDTVRAESIKPTVVAVRSNMRFAPIADRQIDLGLDPQSHSQVADELVARILGDLKVSSVPAVPYVYNAYLAPTPELVLTPGAVSSTPLADMRWCVTQLFPASQLINTSLIESERLNAPTHTVMRTLFAKVDMSRLEAQKPERIFRPLIAGHVLPDIKETPVNVLATLAKRNADTPYSIDPMDSEELWGRIKRAMANVYFVPQASEWLAAQPRITADDAALREWIHKQPESKLKKLLSAEEGFDFVSQLHDVTNLHLMLKGKLKPEMDASYETALKLPQSVQYDRTGKSVATLSPVFRTAVKREAYIMKPNVMVMQRKSLQEVVAFLNMFDHRPNAKGTRRYIEIDQIMFDKAQVREVAELYLKYCEFLGIDPEYIEFVRRSFSRTVSSMKGGVSMIIIDQNVSGGAFTLHRNNSVSTTIMSPHLEAIKNLIEFIIVMGDDFIVAVRGDVDVSRWEADLNRMFNMSAKITIRDQGYICSMDIVHRADGSTTLTRDLVKATLSFMRQDYKDEEKFKELFISFTDSMRYVHDAETQFVLARDLPKRWQLILPGATSSVFHVLIRALCALAKDQMAYRAMFSGALSYRT